jgi:lysozyme
MKVSDKAIKAIIHHEGVRYKPYRCPANLWTIGVGSVLYPKQGLMTLSERLLMPLDPKDNRIFTKDEVDAILKADLQRFERGVLRYCPNSLTQGQFDALVSFSFNVGLGTLQRSTLRQKHNRGDFEGAGSEFMKYTRGGGKVLKGLVNRRKDERAMYGY